MATTQALATDEILGLIRTAWNANAGAAVSGPVPALVYEATEKDLLPHPATQASPWARAVMRHGGGRQLTLGGRGKRRFERVGTLWVQCFIPWKEGADLTVAEALAVIARNAYEGERSENVTFTGVAIAERGRDGAFYRWDMLAQFRWYEIK